MHSLLSITIVVGVLVALSVAIAVPEVDKNKLLIECKTLEKVTDDDIKQFSAHKLPKGPNGKCFMACVYEKNGAIKDKKIQPEPLKMMLNKEFMGNEKALKQINDTVNECKSVNHMDRCELASQLKGCLDKAAVIRGFN